jgi:predicted ester cyclase
VGIPADNRDDSDLGDAHEHAHPAAHRPRPLLSTGMVMAAISMLLGTHEGEIRGIPPSGKSFRCRMAAFFLFAPGGERITCERVYFDQATIVQQLLGDGGLTGRGSVA